MEQQLKERLVGAVVILSVLIIFLPMLFNQGNQGLTENSFGLSGSAGDVAKVELNKELNTELNKELNKANVASLENQLKSLESEKAELVGPVVQAGQVASSVPATASESVAPIAPVNIPKIAIASEKTWVLRMGIFGNPKNATLLIDKLKIKGYQAYSQVDASKGAKITRVFVGPQMSKDRVKKLQNDVKAELKMQGIIVPAAEQVGAVVS